MKKTYITIFLAIILVLTLSSCVAEIEEHTVTFVHGNGESDTTLTAFTYGYVAKPDDPIRENYIFCGWYTDKDYERPYDFYDSVRSDLKLYAKWIPDYAKITNEVMSEVMSANVKLKITHVKNVFGQGSEYATGSGVIFKRAGKVYYALTNNHVVESEGSALATTVTVADIYGNESAAEVLYKSAKYDLAIIRFNSNSDLTALEIKDNTVSESEPVITLGNPNGQINAVTYGKIVDLEAITKDNYTATSKVEFAVYWHTAEISHGSSGGALLDLDYNIIGINYAVSADKDGNFAFGFAVPAEEILEFLDLFF